MWFEEYEWSIGRIKFNPDRGNEELSVVVVWYRRDRFHVKWQNVGSSKKKKGINLNFLFTERERERTVKLFQLFLSQNSLHSHLIPNLFNIKRAKRISNLWKINDYKPIRFHRTFESIRKYFRPCSKDRREIRGNRGGNRVNYFQNDLPRNRAAETAPLLSSIHLPPPRRGSTIISTLYELPSLHPRHVQIRFVFTRLATPLGAVSPPIRSHVWLEARTAH